MASGLKMDEEKALEMVKKGATLLLLNVPKFTLFGVDTQVFSVGPNFMGMKMIPPGPHFIYYNAANKEGNEFSPTVGFFITTQPSEVIVREWHQQEERLAKISEDEEVRYCEAVKHFEFDRHLGPYALDRVGEWKQLSSYITKDTIERIGSLDLPLKRKLPAPILPYETKKRLLSTTGEYCSTLCSLRAASNGLPASAPGAADHVFQRTYVRRRRTTVVDQIISDSRAV